MYGCSQKKSFFIFKDIAEFNIVQIIGNIARLLRRGQGVLGRIFQVLPAGLRIESDAWIRENARPLGHGYKIATIEFYICTLKNILMQHNLK